MKYLSDRGGMVAVIIGSLGVMLFVAYLYGASGEQMLYMALLGYSAAAVFCVTDAVILRLKRNAVRDARMSGGVIDGAELPPARGAFEAEYRALAGALSDELKTIEADYGASVSDMADYYAMWAHQVKTPIAGMRLTLQAGDSRRDRELDAELATIEMYVDMALNYARLDGDDLVIRECDIDDIVKKAVKRFSKQFILSGLTLEYQPLNRTLVTDEKWLRFIIEQLVANAIKYTPSGKISIYSEGGALVIQDTGIGIAPEDLPRVFDKGYTGYNGRGERKSTGIGLYLCKQAANRLGHALYLESEPGRGTRAIINLVNADIPFE